MPAEALSIVLINQTFQKQISLTDKRNHEVLNPENGALCILLNYFSVDLINLLKIISVDYLIGTKQNPSNFIYIMKLYAGQESLNAKELPI